MYILLEETKPQRSTAQDVARVALGMVLVGAGTSHLTFARKPFHAQVPDWVPQKKDTVVVESGLVEFRWARLCWRFRVIGDLWVASRRRSSWRSFRGTSRSTQSGGTRLG